MKKERIDLWSIKKHPSEKKYISLLHRVGAMIEFFNGFEFEDTAIMMSYIDYNNHKEEFTKSENFLMLGGIPVYLNGFLSNGQIHLITIEAAEKLQNATDVAAI